MEASSFLEFSLTTYNRTETTEGRDRKDTPCPDGFFVMKRPEFAYEIKHKQQCEHCTVQCTQEGAAEHSRQVGRGDVEMHRNEKFWLLPLCFLP